MTNYSLFPSTNGPAAGAAYTGNYIAGVIFDVTQGGLWFTGYRWWVPATGADTAPAAGFKFALWQLTGQSTGSLVPGSVVTQATMTAGQWNYIPLPTPLLLSPCASDTYGSIYQAQVGYVSAIGFPDTTNQFGAGNPFSAGITNGPLRAPASNGAGAGFSAGWAKAQMPFSTAAADPSTTFATTNNLNDNLWLDVQVSTVAPASASYRIFPNMPVFVTPGVSAQNLAYTIGIQFSVAQASRLTRIWHYSPPGATITPSRCAIWDVSTQAVVAGTDNQAPAWSGAAASGWISCDYTASGVVLQPGKNYKVSVFTSNNTAPWFISRGNWWGGTPGPFSSGITQGTLVIPGNAGATPGQDSWITSTTWGYPSTSLNPEWDGFDVEVTPVSGSGLLMASGII